MKKQILDVLDGDKNKALFLLSKDSGFYEFLPEALRADSDIVSKLIEIDPKRYHSLSTKLKGNTDIQKTAIETIISGK